MTVTIDGIMQKYFPSIYYPQRSREMYAEMLKRFPEEMHGVVVEVGAYKGYTTKLFAERATRVIAFEPMILNQLAALRRTLSYDNVSIHGFALWEEDKWLYLFGDGDQANSFVTNNTVDSRVCNYVKAISLDNAIADLDKVDFLLLQVNGAEVPIIRGSKLEKVRALCAYSFYEFEGKPCAPQVIKLLKDRGFVVENDGGRIYARRRD